MGTLFSAFDIARSGLQAAQVQLDVAGHNIANVNKEGYSRQRVGLLTRVPNQKTFGTLGRGVAIGTIDRLRESFLDEVYRAQVPDLGSAETKAIYYARIEDIFQEPGESGFGTRLNTFFDAINTFANDVESAPVRESLVAEGEAVAASLNEAAQRLGLLQTNANEEIRSLVEQINSLSEQIAESNENIRDFELGGRKANDLRDDRDVLLDELSRLVNIDYNERDDGQVDVLVSGESLVNAGTWRELEPVLNPAINPDRDDFVDVRFVDTGVNLPARNGELAALFEVRDEITVELNARLDTVARTLIEELNRIHVNGNGLVNFSGPMEASNAVSNIVLPLNSTGLPFEVVDGSFDITTYDAAGAITGTTTVNVTAAGTRLIDISAALNAVPGITTSITDGVLTVTPGAGVSFNFSNDTSNALTALGLNGFFTGDGADNIAMEQDLLEDPDLVSSAFDLDTAVVGDNRAALEMGLLRDALVIDNNSQSINDFYQGTVVKVGVDTRANSDILDLEEAFVQDLSRRRQEVSGVSLDEEVTFLLQFQRAFEASARVVSVTDRMLESLISLGL